MDAENASAQNRTAYVDGLAEQVSARKAQAQLKKQQDIQANKRGKGEKQNSYQGTVSRNTANTMLRKTAQKFNTLQGSPKHKRTGTMNGNQSGKTQLPQQLQAGGQKQKGHK